MRIAIADDSALFRGGLERLLLDLGMDVAGLFSTGTDLVEWVARGAPDVVIVDIRMPPTHTDEGIRAAQAIRRSHPAVGVLVLSTYAEPPLAARLLAEGSSRLGYLLKDRVDDPRALRDALVRIDRGECVLDAELVAELLAGSQRHTVLAGLSARERDVLRLMAEGHSNAGIGRALFLSAKTVESHVSAIFTKLDIPADTDHNRRVRAVLTWLDVSSGSSGR